MQYSVSQILLSNPTVIQGSEVCPPEYGGWSEFEPASNEECEENEQTGNWTKPAKRICNNPEPKYGGICDGKFQPEILPEMIE